MDGNRIAALIVQAHRNKCIDFREAKLLDKNWWTKLAILLEDVERTSVIEIYKLHLAQYVALLSNSNYTNIAEKSSETIYSIAKLLFPWYDLSASTLKQKTISDLSRLWEKRFGNIKDPSTKAKIDRTAAQMLEKLHRAKKKGRK